jgi:hypothetical protein
MLVPFGVSATAAGSDRVTVSWDPVSTASGSIDSVNGYYIYRATNEDGPYTRLNSSATSSTSYTDTGLSPNKEYYYKVSASISTSSSSSWEGAQSSYASAKTPAVGTPSGVSVTAVDSTGVTVSWNTVFGASGYKVYRSESSDGTYTPVGSPTTTSYTDTGASSNTIYYYKVSAYNAGEEGVQSWFVPSDIMYSAVSGGTWTLQSDGRYKSPAISGNSVTKTRISFTGASRSSITIQLAVSSESNCDYAFISQLDNASATYQSDYYSDSRISGENSVAITIPVTGSGSHFIDIGYRKDSSGYSGSDCAWFNVIE